MPSTWSLHVEWGWSSKVVFLFFLLVVVSCSSNEIVATKCGVLGPVVALALGRRFMLPIFIFNIHSFQPLPYLCFCIITHTAFWFNRVGWCFSVTTIAYFIHIEYKSEIVYVLSRSPATITPNLIIHVWLTLSKDRITETKYGMLYVKPKVQLSRAGVMIIHWNWDVIVWYRISLKM